MTDRATSPPIVAATASDRTCESVFGVRWRVLRPWCHEHGIRVTHMGRRPVVVVADVLRALEGAPKPRLTEAEVIRLAAGG